MALNPLKTTERVVGKYIDYITTTFSFKDKDLQRELVKQFSKKSNFYRGPILEATPPFKMGCTLNNLINEGLLSRKFFDIKAGEALPLERNLFLHQEKAIRKIVGENRNLIVATGTGSGKTETFLIPIINHLLREYEKDELTPGVRALLLYPMNALANDQLKRLRKVLRNFRHITFGSYTGETERKYKFALDRYKQMNNGREPLDNELISREQMKAKPPHILLTNYAMLEYLMLRPEDHSFFDGKYANDWKFIVLDEAHTYTGAKAIETSMLLRRLKTRIKRDNTSLRCIATSATIGGGEEDFPEVAMFGKKLFGEPFSYSFEKPEYQDVIKAHKVSMNISTENNSWGTPKELFYDQVKKLIEQKKVEIKKIKSIAIKNGIPEMIIENANKESDGNWQKFLYHLLKNDQRIILLQKLLKKKPQYLDQAAKEIFGSNESAINNLTAVVFLANKARISEEQQPLIPARYHLFIRAIEGAYLSFLPDKKLYLERIKTRKVGEEEYPVFEVGTCQQCNGLYLVGETKCIDGEYYFAQPGEKYFEKRNNLEYYLVISDDSGQVVDNEDELVKSGRNVDVGVKFLLCPKCGRIKQENDLSRDCNCNKDIIRLLKVKATEGLVHKCPSCGSMRSQGSIVWRFLLGVDAITSVLATSLYQQLPAKKQNNKYVDNQNEIWGNGVIKKDSLEEELNYENEGRQLLIFSDSRQDAAFFAPYLQSTYQQIVRRQLIISVLKRNKDKISNNKWRIKDLAIALKQFLSQLDEFQDKSNQEIENLAWKWVLYEFLALDRKNSLEALGLFGFSLKRPNNFSAPPLTSKPWDLSLNEAWDVFKILLDSFRKYGAVLFPEEVSPRDEFFEPRNRQYFFKEKASQRNIYSWCPTKDWILNSRLDFLLRLGERLSKDLTREDCLKLLSEIWNKGFAFGRQRSMFQNYFSTSHDRRTGQKHRIRLGNWEIVPGVIDKKIKWYHCPVCNRITLVNVKGVCPTYRCSGSLKECDPAKFLSTNHYRNLYLDKLPLKMNAYEHTAQLTTEAAADIQSKFNEGEINILSCSTTFELGVDVGELESVFMRNVPPTAANYIQRAGRAGRRTDTTAFSLTFARRKSHDLTYFNNPLDMIIGKVQPPHFAIQNLKIIKRHLYATAFAFFWKKHPEYFGNVEDFFFSEGVKGIDRFINYIQNHPQEIKEFIRKIIPESYVKQIGIDDWNWLEGLIGEDGVLRKANLKLTDEISKLEEAEIRSAENQDYYRANQIKRVIRTIKGKYLINFMSQNNIIPKYGFPVDVVELKIEHHGEPAKNLELSRDLKIALSEYAPGSQVIAGGKLWTSRYLKLLPDRDLIKYKYAICDVCGYYKSENAEIAGEFKNCEACGQPIGRKRGFFVTPEFGFISEKPVNPKMTRPERTYSTRKYFTGEYEDVSKDVLDLELNGIKTELMAANHGKMAVINHAGTRGFSICRDCGHALINGEDIPSEHNTPWGGRCKGRRESLSLGYEFFTDIVQIKFKEAYFGQVRKGFWESVLYGMLEGVSQALGIERSDIDGCLYPYTGDPNIPAIILYDDVPGGAGHVKRMMKGDNFKKSLNKTLQLVNNCQCGGKEGSSSCYGCLRNYANEYCHERLERGFVQWFIDRLIS